MPHKCGSLTNATYGQSWAGCGLPDAPDYRTTRSTEPQGSSRGNAKHTWLPPTERRQDVLEHKNQTNKWCCLRGLSFPVLFLLNCFYQWAFITSSLQQLIQQTPGNISTALPFSGQEVGDSGGEILQSPPLWADLVALISKPDAAGSLGCLPAPNVGSRRGRPGGLWLEVYFFHNLE